MVSVTQTFSSRKMSNDKFDLKSVADPGFSRVDVLISAKFSEKNREIEKRVGTLVHNVGPPWDPPIDPALRTVFNETTCKTRYEMLLKISLPLQDLCQISWRNLNGLQCKSLLGIKN